MMSHDAGMICLEVYYFSLASTGGPSARTTVRPVLTFPGIVRPGTPKMTDHEPYSVPPEDGPAGRRGTLLDI